MGYLLRRTHNLFHNYWMEYFGDVEMPATPVQAGMLIVIEAQPGLTQTALAQTMNVEAPTVLQSIDRLEQNRFLERVRRPEDRRSYSLQLTDRGREVLAMTKKFQVHRDAELMSDLTPDEREKLMELLTRVLVGGSRRVKALQNQASVMDPASRPSGTPRKAKAVTANTPARG
jgi:DNA-binding MarR family transcriptional regulator